MIWTFRLFEPCYVGRAETSVATSPSRDDVEMKVRHLLSAPDAVVLRQQHAVRSDFAHHRPRKSCNCGHYRRHLLLELHVDLVGNIKESTHTFGCRLHPLLGGSALCSMHRSSITRTVQVPRPLLSAGPGSGGGLPFNIPARKHQDRRMTLQRPGQLLGALHAQIDRLTLDRRYGRLRNPRS
jgi:hypothetical protein